MTYLFIWAVVAGAGTGGATYFQREYKFEHNWVNAGAFDAPHACNKAAESLGLSAGKYRCVLKSTGEAK